MNFEGLAPLRKREFLSGNLTVNVGGVKISLQVRKSTEPTDTVLFMFHGAVDRTRRKVPVFISPNPLLFSSCHQVSNSDPALENGFSEDLGMAW